MVTFMVMKSLTVVLKKHNMCPTKMPRDGKIPWLTTYGWAILGGPLEILLKVLIPSPFGVRMELDVPDRKAAFVLFIHRLQSHFM